MTSCAFILVGDVRKRLSELPANSVQCVVTSPPYWGLRDYGNDGQIGMEHTPDEYVSQMVQVFREVWRVLADDGTLWLNLGDSYVGTGSKGDYKDPKYADGRNGQTIALNNKVDGLKSKDLVGIPWRVAFALQADGWYLRQDIIWHKPNPMPESVRDRCTKAHEYLFLLTKSARYYFDSDAIKEDAVTGSWDALPSIGGIKHAEGNDNRTYSGNTPSFDGKRNKRDVWSINTKPYLGAHFAVMPEALVEPCIIAGSKMGDVVLDPFAGSGTVGVVALRHGRQFIGTELNPEYAALAEQRIFSDSPLFNEVSVK